MREARYAGHASSFHHSLQDIGSAVRCKVHGKTRGIQLPRVGNLTQVLLENFCSLSTFYYATVEYIGHLLETISPFRTNDARYAARGSAEVLVPLTIAVSALPTEAIQTHCKLTPLFSRCLS